MDSNFMDTDVAETLNYLRPQVRRINKFRNSEIVSNQKKNSRFLTKDHRTHHSVITDNQSSTSLILKKTVERKVSEKSSVLSYTNLQNSDNSTKDHETPIIQVTVIPNNHSHAKQKKRHNSIKKLQNTLSNQESSIKAKNVYLVVSGKNKEKVYEIKTAGSAEFSSTLKNETNVNQIDEFQKTVDSLNMDKKKSKIKKKDANASIVKDLYEGAGVYMQGSDMMIPDGKDLQTNKSRVRITGRLGLTEDDKYVLRCQATVDDKPIPINYEDLHSPPVKDQNQSKKDKNVKTSKIHANFQFGSNSGSDKRARQFSINVDTETQATQTNLNAMCFSNIESLKIFSNNEHSICTCNKAGTLSGFDTDYDAPRTMNPLVIISVYPKQEQEDNTKSTKKVEAGELSKPESKKSKFQWNKKSNSNNNPLGKFSPNPLAKRTTDPLEKPTKTIEKNDKKPSKNDVRAKVDTAGKFRSPPLSRSPSPTPTPSFARSPSPMRSSLSGRSPSPARSPPPIASKGFTNKYKSVCSSPPSRTSTIDSSPRLEPQSARNRSPSPSSTRGAIKKPKPDNVLSKSPTTKIFTAPPNAHMTLLTNNRANNKNNRKQRFQTSTTENFQTSNKTKLKEQGINTDHRQAKRALVDSYTKRLTKYDKQGGQKYIPKSDVSNITVNIDTDNEYYDLLFHQGDLITDFTVRKTMKDHHNDPHSPSMENFLLTNGEEEKKKSFSQTYLVHPMLSHNSPPKSSPSGHFRVTDSLEIFHRREERANSLSKSLLARQDDRNNVNAPNKHYRGDSCSILDPIERDKEIRELLGVPRATRSKPTMSSFDSFTNSEAYIPMPCVYQLGHQHQHKTIKKTNEKKTKYYQNQVDSNEYVENILDRHDHIWYTNDLVRSSIEVNSPQSSDISKYCQRETSETSPQHSKQQFRKPSPSQSLLQVSPTRPQAPLYQQLILNRNINVYLQIDQFTKQKPIVLSRKQYEKVKRTIESTSGKRQKSCISKKYSVVSVGKIRKKKKTCDKAVQVQLENSKSKKKKNNELCHDETAKCKVCGKKKKDPNCECCGKCRKIVDKYKQLDELVHKYQKKCNVCNNYQGEGRHFCINCANHKYYKTNEEIPNKATKPVMSPVRQTASSVQIRYTSVAYLKHVTFSSTNVKPFDHETQHANDKNQHHIKTKKVDSILTIFKGPRRIPTPNLGTSIYSLNSNYSEMNSPSIAEPEPKPRKPFLQRLMSCLVMRSSGISPVKMGKPAERFMSVDTTMDSYHISTSLGAIDMSSSIYDTSASFYSNHTILPINNKVKRGFLSSMRGLLANRK